MQLSMIPNEQNIRAYGEKVHEVMRSLPECTFEDLQRLCQLKDVELCFTLIFLLKEKKIEQEYNKGYVYYKLK